MRTSTNTLNRRKLKKITNCFASGLTAIDTAHKLKLHRNTVNKYYRATRDAIANYQEAALKEFLETHPSWQVSDYFEWHKNEGLMLNCKPKKVSDLLFGIIVDGNQVYVQKASEIPPENLKQYSNGQSAEHSIISDIEDVDWSVVNVSETVKRFFVYAKEKLIKFYGIKPQYTYLYLKELEFRFNNQDKNLSTLTWKVSAQFDRMRSREKAAAKKMAAS